MPRKGQVQKRIVLPDPVYGSEMVQRFINRMMLDGKDRRTFAHAAQRLAHGEERGGIVEDEGIHIAMRRGPIAHRALPGGIESALFRKRGGLHAGGGAALHAAFDDGLGAPEGHGLPRAGFLSGNGERGAHIRCAAESAERDLGDLMHGG